MTAVEERLEVKTRLSPGAVRWVDGVPQVDFVKLYKPYRKQAEFLGTHARHAMFLGGRFAGKSWTLALRALLLALQNPGVPGLLAGRTEMELKKVQLRYLKRHLQTFREATGINLVRRWSGGDMVCELINGSEIHWRGWEQVDKLRSFDLGWACVDEVEWGLVDSTTLFETLLPAIRVPCPVPGVSFATSPNGYRNATKLWIDRQKALDTNYYLTHAPSAANPHVHPDILEACRRSMSERRFKTEILALALRPVGAVFDAFSMRRHGSDLTPARVDWSVYHLAIGVDFGSNHAAATAVAVHKRTGEWTVISDLASEPKTMGHFRDEFKAWVRKLGANPYLIAGDRAIPEEIQWLQGEYGRQKTFVAAISSKHDQYIKTGVTYIQDWLDPADHGVPKLRFSTALPQTYDSTTAPLVPAMQAYRYKLDREGNPTDEPFKDNITDHVVDSLRYLVVCSLRHKDLHGGILPSRAAYRTPDGFHEDGKDGNNRAHF